MRYFPVNLDIHGSRVVVVGGGPVAARKCAALLGAGAAITVIAPKLDADLDRLSEAEAIKVVMRKYVTGDLLGAVLVFAATDDPEVNRTIAADAKKSGIAVSVADDPAAGTFTLPAAIARGDLLITVSTGGRCPALAAGIRRDLEKRFGSEYTVVADIMGAVREKLLTEKAGSAYNKSLLDKLASRDLPHLAARGAFAEIDRILLDLFGPGYTLAELGVTEKDSE